MFKISSLLGRYYMGWLLPLRLCRARLKYLSLRFHNIKFLKGGKMYKKNNNKIRRKYLKKLAIFICTLPST